MQKTEDILPVYLNMDTAALSLKPEESPYIKNNRVNFGKNKKGEQGSNMGKGKKWSSNWQLITLNLPAGTNKCCGFYEHKLLNEAYVLVWNSNGNHTIFLLYGATMTSDIVYQGPRLNFSLDPRNYIAEHRIYVRLLYDVADDEQRHIREKIFICTDGSRWQVWINVLSSIATKSYDAALFPYYKLSAPHFDGDELIDFAIRPPMYAPVITPIKRTVADLDKQNLIVNKSTSFAYRNVNSDGRASTLSPASNPFFVAKAACGSSKTLTRAVDLALWAGSPHTEMIQVFVRTTNGDWLLYDTLYKFSSDGANDAEVIGDSYWKRTNPWAKYDYDAENNLIHYIYEGDKQVEPFPKNDADDFFNQVPIQSMALTPAGDAIMFCNNLYGYNNFSTDITNKISFKVLTDNDTTACRPKTVKISVYAWICLDGRIGQVVYQYGSEQIFRYGSMALTGQDKTAIFSQQDNYLWNLNFGDSQNFICYLAGTPYASQGVQYKVDRNNKLTQVGVLNSFPGVDGGLIRDTYNDNSYFVQRFDFFVPAGKYIARLAKHGVSLSSNYQRTSEMILGISNSRKVMNGSGKFIGNSIVNYNKEFAIDATQGDVDLWDLDNNLFHIFCPFSPDLLDTGFKTDNNPDVRLLNGYVYEDADSKIPVEYLRHYLDHGGGQRNGTQTDHNGFFWAFANGFNASTAQVYFYGYKGCTANVFLLKTAVPKTLNNSHLVGFQDLNIFLKDYIGEAPVLAMRYTVKGKVVNCTTNEPISSVGVTISNSATFYTDTDGSFEVYMRQNISGTRGSEIDQIYFNAGGTCQFMSCSCGPMPALPVSLKGVICNPSSETFLPEANIKLKLIIVDGNGLKGGGRYGFGVHVADLAGRATFVQEIEYLDIPTFLETGVFLPPVIQWSLSGKLALPPWAKYLIFTRTSNLNGSYLQWVGDKISYIDNKGNSIPSGSGAIRAKVTIQSLLDFNKTNNFNTNVTYQFVQGDILRIYDDGNGNLFPPDKNGGFLDYPILGTDYNQTVAELGLSNVQTITSGSSTDAAGKVTNSKTVSVTESNNQNDGVSLIIEYDERLLALTLGSISNTGFWIEIIRHKELSQVANYAEIAGTIPIVNGEPVEAGGILHTWDTYILFRSIQIPNDLGKSLNHPFESDSVTDYYGKGCTSDGRNNVKDPLAKQTWYEDETILSDDIVNQGRVNGLGRMRDSNRKNFKGQSFGGIVAAHAERNRVIFICEHDWLWADYEVRTVHSTSEGVLRANLDQALSDPYPKEGSISGCAYEDTATVVFWDGVSIWADRYNSAITALDYRHNNNMIATASKSATNLAEASMESYFLNKFNYMNKFNESLSQGDYLGNLIELIGGIDPQTGAYNLTFRPRVGLKTDPQYFVNNEREVFYDMAETVIYEPKQKRWTTFAGYCPEFYGRLSKAASGVELITFANGAPWFHNSIGKPGVMNFYGVQTNHVMEVSCNMAEKDNKIFQNAIINSPDVKYFIDRIRTEDEKFFSYVPLNYWEKREFVWFAAFLCNMGSYPDRYREQRQPLINGGRTFGKLALVRLVGDPRDAEKYGELQGFGYNVTLSSGGEKI